MNRVKLLFVAALVVAALPVSSARAGVIRWDYSWSMSPASGAVEADNNRGKVLFTLEQPGTNSNSSDIGATNLATVTQTASKTPARFDSQGYYTLTLTLKDRTSGLSGAVTFEGKFSGTFSKTNANIDNHWIGGATRVLDLGNEQYTVTIGPYVPPGPPSSNNLGSIGAHVAVSSLHVSDVPEPTALVLSCVGGLALLGSTTRHFRKRLLSTES